MREINLGELLPDIILRFKGEQESRGKPVFLTMPPSVPGFSWSDESLEKLIPMLVGQAVSESRPERPVRIAVAQKMRLQDLETLLNLHPSNWIQLSIDVQSLSGPTHGVGEELVKLGYSREEEWVTEDLHCHLTAFSHSNQIEPPILFFTQARKANHKYAL